MVSKNRRHPISVKTSLYVNVPFYLREEQHLSEKSDVVYQRVGEKGLIIKVGEVE